jgi:7-cyano-7-deazaguanine synthase in queuosine biosynthesis
MRPAAPPPRPWAGTPVLLLASGGIRSTVLAYQLAAGGCPDLTLLYVNLGTAAAAGEAAAVEAVAGALAAQHVVLDLSRLAYLVPPGPLTTPGYAAEHPDEPLTFPNHDVLIATLGRAIAGDRCLLDGYYLDPLDASDVAAAAEQGAPLARTVSCLLPAPCGGCYACGLRQECVAPRPCSACPGCERRAAATAGVDLTPRTLTLADL